MDGYRPSGRADIARLQKGMNELFERARAVPPQQELAGDLNRYACVRTCGFLEQAIASLARSACQSSGWGIGRDFGLSWLERAGNPSAREVTKLIGRFSTQWEQEFTEFLADDERKSRLNALVGLRNEIAHGKNQGVSAQQAQGYFQLACEVVEWLAERLEPIPTKAQSSKRKKR